MHAAVAKARRQNTMTEADLMRAVTDLATILGWEWAHFRPAQTSKGWRTPVSGPLGKGFPDLLLIRESNGQVLFAELKADGGRVSQEQAHFIDILFPATIRAHGVIATAVWYPVDLDNGVIAAALR